MFDVLKISPEVLEEVAKAVESYCGIQLDLMDNYTRQVSAINGEWSDDQTFGPLYGEICKLFGDLSITMGNISKEYPSYFKQKAAEIYNRPKL